jgi:hypothetical protein
VSVTNIMMMMLLRKMLSKMSMMMRRMETRWVFLPIHGNGHVLIQVPRLISHSLSCHTTELKDHEKNHCWDSGKDQAIFHLLVRKHWSLFRVLSIVCYSNEIKRKTLFSCLKRRKSHLICSKTEWYLKRESQKSLFSTTIESMSLLNFLMKFWCRYLSQCCCFYETEIMEKMIWLARGGINNDNSLSCYKMHASSNRDED